MKILVDTCVIIDALQNRQPFASDAQKLFSLFDVVDTFGIDCINAVSSQMGDYEDAVMSETAERNSIDYIVTRNIKDYSKSKVQVITPSVFLGLL